MQLTTRASQQLVHQLATQLLQIWLILINLLQQQQKVYNSNSAPSAAAPYAALSATSPRSLNQAAYQVAPLLPYNGILYYGPPRHAPLSFYKRPNIIDRTEFQQKLYPSSTSYLCHTVSVTTLYMLEIINDKRSTIPFILLLARRQGRSFSTCVNIGAINHHCRCYQSTYCSGLMNML